MIVVGRAGTIKIAMGPTRLGLLTLIVGGATALASPGLAHAEGESCERDSECAGTELCDQQICTVSDQPGQACGDEAENCQEWDTCVDGFCKRHDITCRDATGVCFAGDTVGECQCVNAPGVEWVGPLEGIPIDTCFSRLAETCPDEVAPPQCESDELLARCEAYVANEHALTETCRGYVDESPFAVNLDIEQCCGEDSEPGIAQWHTCVIGLEDDDCAGEDACGSYEPGGGSGVDQPVDASGDDAGQADADKGGCRVGTPGSSGLLFLVLGAFGWGRRRR